jgi:hypothetical protein
MVKKLFLVLLVAFLGLQFFRPEKNISNERSRDISTKYAIPAEVDAILKVACNDCHSNYTRYPWYANVQPVTWWLNNHVTDGKKHLNFSTFAERRIAVQNHKFEEIIETVRDKYMPMESYTALGLHPEAKLTEQQRNTLINWAQSQMDSLKVWYPADSLVMPKRQNPPPAQK